MQLLKNRSFYLKLYFFVTTLGYFIIYKGDFSQIMFVKFFRFASLFFFYYLAVKKPNIVFIAFIILEYITSILYSWSSGLFYCIILLLVSRIILLLYLFRIINWKGFNKTLFSLLSIVTLTGIAVLVYYFSSVIMGFYSYLELVVISELFLVLLFSFAFLNQYKTINKGNLELLIGIVLFIVGDLSVGALNPFYSNEVKVAVSVLYVFAEFLVVYSNVLRQKALC